MNLLEIWIEDVVRIDDIMVNNSKKIKVTFNTICWGSKEIKTRIFDNLEQWEEFKARKYYLG